MKAAVAKTLDGHSLHDDPAPGWYRELVARRSGDKVDAYYYPPDGTQLRSRPDVRRCRLCLMMASGEASAAARAGALGGGEAAAGGDAQEDAEVIDAIQGGD